MHARIVQVSLLPEVISDAENYFRESIGPALKLQPGFKNGRFLVNQMTNQCLMITLWETEEARTESESNGPLQSALRIMNQYFAGNSGIEYYEVVVQIV